MGLTPKQQLILDFIKTYNQENGYAPSQQEIANQFNFSSLGTVQNYIVRLREQGHLENNPNEKRGMKVIETDIVPIAQKIQLLGRVAAGKPIEAITHLEDLEVPKSMLKGNGDFFALQVQGDSMIEDGILEGDFVVVRRQRTAQNGETVIAIIDDEATIKRYYFNNNQIELRPANPAYKPIQVQPQNQFSIAGVLQGVIRQF